MSEQDLFSVLKNKFPVISEEGLSKYIIIPSGEILEICLFLKEELGFNYLMSLSAVSAEGGSASGGDYKDNFAVVYHLYSFITQNKLTLKVFLDKEKPSVNSVSKIWAAANWHEREAYDLMGISFVWHPDLRRILLPDDWVGHPLRKDYTKPDMLKMPQV